MKRFKEYLKKNNLCCTPERLEMVKAVMSFDESFTIEDLSAKIKNSAWSINRSTLYRNIPLFIKAGIIKPEHSSGLGQHLFRKNDDYSGSRTLECSICGRIVNVPEEIIEKIKMLFPENGDVKEIVDTFLMMHGHCTACQPVKKKNPSLSPMRILLFEDNNMVRFLLKSMLEEYGHEVYEFPDPCCFYDDCKCSSNPCHTCADMIIIDVKMPGMSGVEFIERLRGKNCKIENIAFISGNWLAEDLDYALGIGAQVFHKPFDVTDLQPWFIECSRNISKDRVLTNNFLEDQVF